MIFLEILFLVAFFAIIVYILFFSKNAQRIATAAEHRNREITSPSDTSPDSLAARVQSIEDAKQSTSEAIAARKQAVADEASKLEKISVK